MEDGQDSAGEEEKAAIKVEREKEQKEEEGEEGQEEKELTDRILEP